MIYHLLASSRRSKAHVPLVVMLAAQGESTLYDVYPINRGYENLHERLTKLGANIKALD